MDCFLGDSMVANNFYSLHWASCRKDPEKEFAIYNLKYLLFRIFSFEAKQNEVISVSSKGQVFSYVSVYLHLLM